MQVYDITQEVYGCAVYPGDPAPRRELLLQTARGDVCNLSAIHMCVHNGTHVDAPFHFLPEGRTVEQIPVETFVGECFVAHFTGDIDGRQASSLLTRAGEAGRRILIGGPAVVTEEAARVFAGILLLGNESQTVGPETAPAEVHRILLGAGTVLLEGIRLDGIPEGRYLLCAAPLKLGDSDGAPCRAVLIADA